MRRLTKRFPLLLVLIPLTVLAAPLTTYVTTAAQTSMAQNEVLVLNTAVAVPASALVGRRSIEIQNRGPNSIFCGPGTPVALKAREIRPGESWAADVVDTIALKCITASVNQLTTAATIVTESK